ncbi:MAG: hypothetical protein ABIT16_11025 [Croceibacterium sp.]
MASQGAKSCGKCSGRMEQGFMLEFSSRGVTGVTEWAEGLPVRSFWLGLKLRGRKRHTMETWRCSRCGFLESYAPDA